MTATVASVQRADILSALRWIMDPEIGVDIVTLGLIYGITIERGDVRIAMTMTTRGCPLHATITEAVHDAICWLDGVGAVMVEMVWEPPWHPVMIDRAALP
jgi:metal-sulfur cluster biosynthetic enzyme